MQFETEAPCLFELFLQTLSLKPSAGFFSSALRLDARLSIIFSMSFENFSVVTDTTRDLGQITTGGAWPAGSSGSLQPDFTYLKVNGK